LLQDVSDLLEKEPEQSAKVLRLESNSLKVIRRDWSQLITEALRAGTVNVNLSCVLVAKKLFFCCCYHFTKNPYHFVSKQTIIV